MMPALTGARLAFIRRGSRASWVGGAAKTKAGGASGGAHRLFSCSRLDIESTVFALLQTQNGASQKVLRQIDLRFFSMSVPGLMPEDWHCSCTRGGQVYGLSPSLSRPRQRVGSNGRRGISYSG